MMFSVLLNLTVHIFANVTGLEVIDLIDRLLLPEWFLLVLKQNCFFRHFLWCIQSIGHRLCISAMTSTVDTQDCNTMACNLPGAPGMRQVLGVQM